MTVFRSILSHPFYIPASLVLTGWISEVCTVVEKPAGSVHNVRTLPWRAPKQECQYPSRCSWAVGSTAVCVSKGGFPVFPQQVCAQNSCLLSRRKLDTAVSLNSGGKERFLRRCVQRIQNNSNTQGIDGYARKLTLVQDADYMGKKNLPFGTIFGPFWDL